MPCFLQGKVNWPNARWAGGTMAEIGQMFATNWVAAIQHGLRKNGETTSVMLPRGGTQKLAHGPTIAIVALGESESGL